MVFPIVPVFSSSCDSCLCRDWNALFEAAGGDQLFGHDDLDTDIHLLERGTRRHFIDEVSTSKQG